MPASAHPTFRSASLSCSRAHSITRRGEVTGGLDKFIYQGEGPGSAASLVHCEGVAHGSKRRVGGLRCRTFGLHACKVVCAATKPPPCPASTGGSGMRGDSRRLPGLAGWAVNPVLRVHGQTPELCLVEHRQEDFTRARTEHECRWGDRVIEEPAPVGRPRISTARGRHRCPQRSAQPDSRGSSCKLVVKTGVRGTKPIGQRSPTACPM